jgi:hypothetical protein
MEDSDCGDCGFMNPGFGARRWTRGLGWIAWMGGPFCLPSKVIGAGTRLVHCPRVELNIQDFSTPCGHGPIRM